jgi:hypothetical protein
MIKAPDEKTWRQKWTKEQVPKILSIAEGYRVRGAPNDRSAWMAAEDNFLESKEPFRSRGGK